MIGLSHVSIAARKTFGMFQRPGPPEPDGTGYVQSWLDVPPAVFAFVTPATQANLEKLTAGTVLSIATDLVTVPYRQAVTLKMRFTFEGRNLSILDINDPGERHTELVLVCAEVVE